MRLLQVCFLRSEDQQDTVCPIDFGETVGQAVACVGQFVCVSFLLVVIVMEVLTGGWERDERCFCVCVL